jgi:hypothetical protein
VIGEQEVVREMGWFLCRDSFLVGTMEKVNSLGLVCKSMLFTVECEG